MERTGKASQRLETLKRAALEKRREEMRRWQAVVDDLEQGNYERLHARIAGKRGRFPRHAGGAGPRMRGFGGGGAQERRANAHRSPGGAHLAPQGQAAPPEVAKSRGGQIPEVAKSRGGQIPRWPNPEVAKSEVAKSRGGQIPRWPNPEGGQIPRWPNPEVANARGGQCPWGPMPVGAKS